MTNEVHFANLKKNCLKEINTLFCVYIEKEKETEYILTVMHRKLRLLPTETMHYVYDK